jgi:hypothetical protein
VRAGWPAPRARARSRRVTRFHAVDGIDFLLALVVWGVQKYLRTRPSAMDYLPEEPLGMGSTNPTRGRASSPTAVECSLLGDAKHSVAVVA